MKNKRMKLMSLLTLAAVLIGGLSLPSIQAQALSLAHPAPEKTILISTGAKELKHGAQKFIDNMGKRAIEFLGNDALSQSQKEAKFKSLLRSSFDLKTIGRFALGRYWRSATPAQQKEYNRLFENMVVRVYATRFNEYSGQTLDIGTFRQDGAKDTIVTSYIVPPDGGEKIKVDWRVRNKNGAYKIVDVIIEGVSMALTQRSDFSSVIQRGGGDISALLVHLRKQQ